MRAKCLLILLLLLGVVGCATAVSPTATPVAPTAGPIVPTETAVPPQVIHETPTLPTSTQNPTAIPTVTATTPPVPTATPHPMTPFTIDGLRQQAFPGGVIQVGALLAEEAAFSRYAISYPRDSRPITGTCKMPVMVRVSLG